ncbi:MAG TPA: hypothetical protein P5279_11000, partial [Anaerohalosphaeraceae bacterium]|nr:hypothetical protein [Anaerohalosphaeraceae bacterium]HRT51013.1 hypothetical protein [Anaerohalosphaeraceae bacterium]HRT86999.1 hypothetical protein [Anaerohalosphaeraceae bacterium]
HGTSRQIANIKNIFLKRQWYRFGRADATAAERAKNSVSGCIEVAEGWRLPSAHKKGPRWRRAMAQDSI